MGRVSSAWNRTARVGILLLVGFLVPTVVGCPGSAAGPGKAPESGKDPAPTNSPVKPNSPAKPNQGGGEASPRADLSRGTIWIELTETLDDLPTSLNITQLLVSRSLAHHGFDVVSDSEKDQARFHLTGSLDCDFDQIVKMEVVGVSRELEHQWWAQFDVTLLDRGASLSSPDDDRVEQIKTPEPLHAGRSNPKLAKRDIRRKGATELAQRVTRGSLLGVPEVAQLIDAWTDSFEPRSFNEIQLDLIDHGYTAVPFLLETLNDKRVVAAEGSYPGLAEFNREELKLYHLADDTLAEILQKDPALDLLSTEKLRIRVVTGWTWFWEDTIDIPAALRIQVEQRKTKTPAAPRG